MGAEGRGGDDGARSKRGRVSYCILIALDTVLLACATHSGYEVDGLACRIASYVVQQLGPPSSFFSKKIHWIY